MEHIQIDGPKGIWPACDVSIEELAMIARASAGIKGVNALKIGGIRPTLLNGLTSVVKVVRDYTDKPIVFDYQKAGNDIPPMGKPFAEDIYTSGIDAVILFPFAGAETERAWIEACQSIGLHVIVGGHMTQEKFLASEGGFIYNPKAIYEIAANMGVRHFIVPGNKVDFVREYREFLQSKIIDGRFRLSAPGFLAQGGVISETGQVAGDYWDAIVGRDINKHKTVATMKSAIENLVAQISAT